MTGWPGLFVVISREKPPTPLEEAKREAAQLLLEWGFAPSEVVRMLGCARDSIDSIRDGAARHE